METLGGAFGLAFFTGLGLIAAIGSQNAFVLRQGLHQRHVLPLVLFCGLSDTLLIGAGVLGFGVMIEIFPLLPKIMLVGGALFLAIYGNLRLHAAWLGGYEIADGETRTSLRACLALAAAFTWLNPHVYLDTMALMGSISTQFETAHARLGFFLGGAAASFAFFAALGFGAKFLSPFFKSPKSWRILDLIVGLTMWVLVLKLLLF